jgi:two-component system phosphate regulon sensor histidine kinase PhoR
MSKPNVLLISICAIALAVVLLLPSLTTRAVFAAVLLIGVALLTVRTFSNRSPEADLRSAAGSNSQESAQEIFARGKLFEATMNGMREGLLVVDKDMRVVASNTAAHRLFNLSRGKLDAQRLTELTRNPAIYSAFLDGLKGIERSGVKVEIHGPERLVFDLRVVPLGSGNFAGDDQRDNPRMSGDSADQPAGALGVFIDVTRTEHLEQVRQEFLSNVSHELRTPLTAILAFIETLEAGAIDDKEASQRFLSIIRKNASRMHELIDDILELSAIEAGNVPVKVESVELRPIVSDVISSLANKAAAQSLTLNNAVPPDALVQADARRLEQMLTNLMENAIKFNREHGSVTIKFERGKQDSDRDSADRGSSPRVSKGSDSLPNQARRDRIVVEDSGEGIPAQHLERLFERFYRVDRARSRELGGIGLGLAIVKHLALAHGGEVTVTSELGKGSTFTIELPSN